jgi:enamine deaminase RidA (YjgF/YER057c/UK114 family)
MNQRINVDSLLSPPAYSHVAVASGTLVFTAGAVPLDADGKLVGPGDYAAQARQTLDNLRAQLEAGGARPEDVVKTTVYVATTVMEQLDAVWDVIASSDFAGAPSTLLGVAMLGYTDQLVEVEAVAVLD